jgi:hypothetical protein
VHVYDLKSDDLKNLDQTRAVFFFRKLLWAEASRVGIGRNLVDFPDCINVGDGGLDAVIKDAGPLFDDVIPSGLSGYQIKSSNLYPGDCKRELHRNKDLKEPLKAEIERLFGNDGAYILVLFAEMTNPLKRKREGAIKEELERMGYVNPKIRVYTINQIIGFAERFFSLVAWLKGYPIECFPYEKWAENSDVSIPRTFISDEQRETAIEGIREKLRSRDDNSPAFRIIGLSGLGKTRLAFQALSPDDIRNRVIYARAETFRNSTLHNTLVIDDGLEAIIVVDDCSSEDHDILVRSFSNRGPRLNLITISYETHRCPPPTLSYQLGPLSQEDIRKLLSEEVKGLPQNVIHRLADFADGYPRVALLLAESYLSGDSTREDILAVNDDVLINKLIAGRNDSSSDWFRKTKKVLMGLSLFEKVAYKGNLPSEARWVADLVNVAWTEFQELVNEQRKRGIIQGEYFIHVTPFFLAAHLAREWWDTYGNDLDFEEFIQNIPAEFGAEMTDRFISRFPYITTTDPGRKLVRKLLSNEGIFADGSLLKTDIGAKFFLKLTEADPESALNCLKRTIGTWSKKELLDFRIGRREIVWALERIVIWRYLFADAARLLLALGEAENESYSNNASGVFADLFSPAPGPVAPTEASLEERYPILMEAINSDSAKRKFLALKGFRKALQSGHFTRTVGPEYQGSRPPPDLWTPKTYKEIFDYYRKVWNYLEENLGKFDNETREEAVSILLGSARGVARVNSSFSELIIATVRKMASYTWLDKSRLLSVISKIIHYDGKEMPENVLEEWISLKDELTGTTFSDVLKRFVEMDFLEDYFHDGKKHDRGWVESKIRELAEKAIENPDILESEYSWLTTDKAERGYQFGYELGKLDTNFSFLEKLIEKQRKTGDNGSVYFLGGYFKVLFEKNTLLWEKKLDTLSKDKFFKKFIPELTWRSGMTDRAAEMILSMAKKGDIDTDDFRIFKFGSVINKISEPILIRWIKHLLKEPSGKGTFIALGFVSFYYIPEESDKPLPKDLVLEILLHPMLWENPEDVSRDQGVDYHWKLVGSALINQFPETGILLAEQIIKFFGDKRSLLGGLYSETREVLLEIVKRDPKKLWESVEKYLGPPIDTRSFYLGEWLKGRTSTDGKRALEYFNPEDIWEWGEDDIETRAWYLATIVPPTLFHSKDEICFARELLVRYGNRNDVRDSFSANFFTEAFSGSFSGHYMNKKEYLLEFRKKEANKNVIKWVDECVERLERNIERARFEEERRGF